MKIPQTTTLRSTYPSFVVSPEGTSIITSSGQVCSLAGGGNCYPQSNGGQPSTAIIIDQPKDNWAWLKGLIAATGLSVLACQVLSRTGNQNVSRLYKQGSNHFQKLKHPNFQEDPNQFHVFLPGTGVERNRQRHALDLSMSIGQPVHTLHIGTEAEKHGPIARGLNYIRSGLNVLSERLGYQSPWGGGYDLAVEGGINAIAEAVKQKNNQELKVYLHGYSIGGSIASQIAAAAKTDPRLKDVQFAELNTYGAPISKATEDFLRQGGLTVNAKMSAHDPARYFRKANNPFELVLRACQAGRMALEKGLEAHRFNSYISPYNAA